MGRDCLTREQRAAVMATGHGEPRPDTLGRRLVAEALLPLSLCQPSNRTRGAAGWALARDKRALWSVLSSQVEKREAPLQGRPLVIMTRVSSVEPDRYSDWGKSAVDMLCVARGRAKLRLGLLQDDSPRCAEVWQLWRPGKRGEGFVFLEVWA